MLSRSPVASIVRRTAAAILWFSVSGIGVADASPATPEPPITLADDMNLGDCVSALPKPGCRTTNTADWQQLVLLGLLLSAFAFIVWRISRTVRLAQAAQRAQAGPMSQSDSSTSASTGNSTDTAAPLR